MKSYLCFLVIMLYIFFNGIDSKAQGDTLIIKLKNNQIEKIAVSQIQKIQFENVTSVEEQSNLSNGLTANGNYPNPFADRTSIEFEISLPGRVVIIIYDNSGSQIQKLECENCQSGKNTLDWNCRDEKNNRVQSGTYYYEVRFNNEIQSQKMILVK
ncbi:MAG: T9SS type A sorting domain-containing protein [Candidatus Kapabacteria bacterium]|nr:T9SS type A sorting domain-containing protein [Candidatus Kapabacteria bacterium]